MNITLKQVEGILKAAVFLIFFKLYRPAVFLVYHN